jgi:hypothetical protein
MRSCIRDYQNRSHHWRDKFFITYQYKKHKFTYTIQCRFNGKIFVSCIRTIWRICLSSDDSYLDSSLMQGVHACKVDGMTHFGNHCPTGNWTSVFEFLVSRFTDSDIRACAVMWNCTCSVRGRKQETLQNADRKITFWCVRFEVFAFVKIRTLLWSSGLWCRIVS